MRTILILCGVILLAGGVFLYRTMRLPSRYGKFTGGQKVEVADLIDRPKDFLHKPLAVEGVVRNQCTTMGCYFFFESGKKTLRVDLQEIAMNAPRKNGHRVRVEGQMVPYGDGYQFFASAVEFK